MNNLFSKSLLSLSLFSGGLVFVFFFFLGYLCLNLFSNIDFFNLFSFDWDEYSNSYGILIMVIGTIIISFNALVLGFIFSISLAISIFLLKNKYLKFIFEKTILIMSAVPTVIYAFSALLLIVPFVSAFKPSSTLSIFIASITLSLLLVPTMSLFFLNIFNNLSAKYQGSFLTLGLTKEQFLFNFILKQSYKNILSGVILALSRAIGDTMIALMLAGNALVLPHSIFDSTRTLTSHIALIFANDYNSFAFQAVFLSAFLLLSSNFILILLLKRLNK